jgi:hypothetical protein
MSADQAPEGAGTGETRPEALRRLKSELRSSAAGMQRNLHSSPPAFDEGAFGRPETTSAVNNALSALFKQTADLAAGMEHAADQIKPEDGSPGGTTPTTVPNE